METTNNLQTFRILFIVKGVLNLLLALFFLGFAGFFSFIASDIAHNTPSDMPFNPLTFFGVFWGIGFALSVVFAILTFMAAKYLGEARKHTFIIVIAVLNCLSGIIGIVLGIFTIIEITKPEVRALFETNSKS
ncbi:MAG: hypothetical protein WBG71_01585 [Leeuwenhoekiella sp.]